MIILSVLVILPSITESDGKATTRSDAGRLNPLNSGVIWIDLLTIAKSGIINIKITIEAPTRLPTNTSGLFLRRELMPTEISPMEVKKPKRTKETINDDILSFLDIFSTDLTVSPDPIQTPIKEKR